LAQASSFNTIHSYQYQPISVPWPPAGTRLPNSITHSGSYHQLVFEMTTLSTCESQQSMIELVAHSERLQICLAVIVALMLRTFHRSPLKVFLFGQKAPMSHKIMDDVEEAPEELEQKIEEPTAVSPCTLDDFEQKLEASLAALLEEELNQNVNNEVYACMQSDTERELMEEMQSDMLELYEDLSEMDADIAEETMPISVDEELEQMPQTPMISSLDKSEAELEVTMTTFLEKELEKTVNYEVYTSMQADLEDELLQEMQSDLMSLCDELNDGGTL